VLNYLRRPQREGGVFWERSCSSRRHQASCASPSASEVLLEVLLGILRKPVGITQSRRCRLGGLQLVPT